MIKGRCPTCSLCFEVASIDDLPTFPFCSERCRLVDLGRWFDGTYTVPEDVAAPTPIPDESENDEGE